MSGRSRRKRRLHARESKARARQRMAQFANAHGVRPEVIAWAAQQGLLRRVRTKLAARRYEAKPGMTLQEVFDACSVLQRITALPRRPILIANPAIVSSMLQRTYSSGLTPQKIYQDALVDEQGNELEEE